MALEGTLKDFSLADIFQLIGLQRKTGVLTLRGKDDTVTVTFLEGKVVAADTLNKRIENRLGHVLVKTGRLSHEQLNRALEIQRETLQRLGFILTHYEMISRESLQEALQLQILQVIYRLFRWKDGDYQFSQETTIEYDRDNVAPITAESILMEGARMIDEWPIIEKRIRSYDMLLRRKEIDQEIVVVDEDEADDVDFDLGGGVPAARGKAAVADQIRISRDEKMVYDLVDGRNTVREIVERSRTSEFDTCKSLYELMTRDLIEEVRARTAAPALPQEVGEAAPTEVPTVLPWPMVVLLVALAAASVATLSRNPLNGIQGFGRDTTIIEDTRKAVSLQRIESIGEAIFAYILNTGRPPERLADLAPAYVDEAILYDPWGRAYTYVYRDRPVDQYVVIGFEPDGQPDTDLFLSRVIESGSTVTSPRQLTGGIELVD
ncbi:MAG TPA: DUF4388 domain-containing protein [Thermoanaerobaculia bacterium]|nr:DUF4388 domain-containing protein [Thermoanaerobaculia bacterium]